MTQKLLFVDDSLTMHRVVAITFGQEDVTLVSAHSAAEALQHVASSRVDVALVDSHLGDMDGYSLCAELQQAHGGPGGLPVLLLVSDQHPLDEAKRVACGAVGAVKKPFDTQTLVARVKEASALRGPGVPGHTAAPSPGALAPTPQSSPSARPQSADTPERAAAAILHAAAPRPAFFQAPPPVPLSADRTNPWTLSAGGPPAIEDNLPQSPLASIDAGVPNMPLAADLPQMPTWSLDGDGSIGAGDPHVADTLPQEIPPNEPLWTTKESTTAEDLRQPVIDAEVMQLARSDKDRAAEGDVAPAQTAPPMSHFAASASAGAAATGPQAPAGHSAVARTAQALGAAFAQLPPQVAAALGPQAAEALAPALVQAIERAIWDVLPGIAQTETRAYLARQPRG